MNGLAFYPSDAMEGDDHIREPKLTEFTCERCNATVLCAGSICPTCMITDLRNRAEKAEAEVTRLREVLKLAKDTIMVLKPRGLKLDREQAEMTLGRLAAELEGE